MWGWKAAVQAGGDQDGPLVGGSGQLTEQGFGDPNGLLACSGASSQGSLYPWRTLHLRTTPEPLL